MGSARKRSRLTLADLSKISPKIRQQIKKQRAALDMGSIGEEDLSVQLRYKGINYVKEYSFDPTRNFRADFYLTDFNLLVEVEGGTRGKSRHTTHDGYSTDLIKYNSAQILGFSLLRYTTEQVKKGMALESIELFIKSRNGVLIA
ncbi:hypothetical protein P255_02961 [Acinetobacter brisouii CIP 110357]|uniref:DUF559 domain-containing protein n=1 Tax=Acinetobacter brisouii CIP 110357 TaxID=1341683 RepID=V2VIX7_9GAMM|nr:hypothetical protein [Acinetobacter brisouii]ENV46206.1 hypothetical protein F954_02841 [Acinetobacter brisouii ANC 4119]ESK47479.1 hypothetical protein P255_02961 [Acinetobacter brisouii CIP 110357]